MHYRFSLLLGAAFLSLPTVAVAQATPAPAQPQSVTPPATQAPAAGPAADTSDEYGDDEDAIVVTGSRTLPGSVVGDIPPENTLDSRDVRATGATNISELLDAIAPQIGSTQGRGGGQPGLLLHRPPHSRLPGVRAGPPPGGSRGGEQPVLLLNGQRISGFRELRDVPTEAISRVEILPEEVALKYGYRADQKVVNIVLRNRFRSTAVQVAGTTATEGGYVGGNGD